MFVILLFFLFFLKEIFILIFEFILVYLLYVLFVLKVEGNFKKRKSQLQRVKTCYFLYIY